MLDEEPPTWAVDLMLGEEGHFGRAMQISGFAWGFFSIMVPTRGSWKGAGLLTRGSLNDLKLTPLFIILRC